MAEAERSIAQANPPSDPGRGKTVERDDTIPRSTIRDIRQAHASLTDERGILACMPNRSRPQTSIRVDVTVRDELSDVADSIGYTLNELLQLLACVDRGVILDMADKWAWAAEMAGRDAARESSRRASLGLNRDWKPPK